MGGVLGGMREHHFKYVAAAEMSGREEGLL